MGVNPDFSLTLPEGGGRGSLDARLPLFNVPEVFEAIQLIKLGYDFKSDVK